ncbi:MAG: hypothetical protein AAF682_15730 [Planctomycetota bacterium]
MEIVQPVRSGCPLLGWLARALARYHRAPGGAPPSDSAHGADVLLTLTRLSKSRGSGPKRLNQHYLLQAVLNDARLVTRRELGRTRCRNCTHYLGAERACSYPGNPYPRALDGASNPRRLDPPCEQYSPRRRMGALTDGLADGLAGPAEDDSPAERVWRAFERLRAREPKLHALVFELYIEGRTRVALAAQWGVHRKTVERHERRALGLLKSILEDLP